MNLHPVKTIKHLKEKKNTLGRWESLKTEQRTRLTILQMSIIYRRINVVKACHCLQLYTAEFSSQTSNILCNRHITFKKVSGETALSFAGLIETWPVPGVWWTLISDGNGVPAFICQRRCRLSFTGFFDRLAKFSVNFSSLVKVLKPVI